MQINQINIIVENSNVNDVRRILDSGKFDELLGDCQIDVFDYTQGLKDSKDFFITHPHLDEDLFFQSYYDKDSSYVSVSFEGYNLDASEANIDRFANEVARELHKKVFFTIDYVVSRKMKVIEG